MTAYTYLTIDLCCLIIPLIFSFSRRWPFYREWKAFFPACVAVAIPFILWDVWFVKMGIWGFTPKYLTGLTLFSLPLEEVLFFVCIPYACVFTYYALKKMLPPSFGQRQSTLFLICYVVVSVVLICFGAHRWYTLSVGITSLIFGLYAWYRAVNLIPALLTYIAIFPFFLLSNGILTGSFLMEPVVWYDHTENLGLRLWTIPVEDSLYGLLLILLNIHLYDVISEKRVRAGDKKN